ncbi:DUF4202 domain-containing protein [Sandaracinus amylolyticus]|uniref:DUF4202 domain-containing protein n=1 Tax=Sandaracinus amylolyticus TaxID=927083 RepID=A0A0F6W658_9BACT|nr:DUF4202 domain-containing protein [Sandaracinus amylolyticus]AKF08487.1 hypothetical protein DB32_005636 [Sandaracinus amylolyticus]
MTNDERLERTLAAIDAVNAADPTGEAVTYGRRMSAALAALRPDASDALRIAVRAQHVERWKVPRATYPEGRVGYLKWRRELGAMHAQRASEIMRAEGWDEGTVARVASIVQKQKLASDADTQALEDCACLVFLAHGFDAFAAQHDDAKVIDILRKTWAKMSDTGHAAALAAAPSLSERAQSLIGRALGG